MLRFLLGMVFGFFIVMMNNGGAHMFSYSEVGVFNSISELSLFRAISADEQAREDDSSFENQTSSGFESKLGMERASIRFNVSKMTGDSASTYEKSCKVRSGIGLSSRAIRSEHGLERFNEDYLDLSASTLVATSYDYLMEASVYCL